MAGVVGSIASANVSAIRPIAGPRSCLRGRHAGPVENDPGSCKVLSATRVPWLQDAAARRNPDATGFRRPTCPTLTRSSGGRPEARTPDLRVASEPRSSRARMVPMGTQAALRREGILKTLRESRELLQAFGVARLSLFGSFARDEGRHESDVDLLVEFSRPIGLFEFAR